ncbi:MAG: AAA family ATPase [Bacteroidales bacterium]
MVIVGITGTLGAGKGTVVEYLVREKQFAHFSVREFLREELEKRQMPVNRDTLTAIANSIRAKHGPSHIAEALIKKAKKLGLDCVIESIRTPGEVEALRREEAFFLLAVDADPRIRYKRIRQRNSETDRVSYTTFIMNEEREMHTNDPNKQNLAACINAADYVIRNDGSLANLHRNTEAFLKHIGTGQKKQPGK